MELKTQLVNLIDSQLKQFTGTNPAPINNLNVFGVRLDQFMDGLLDYAGSFDCKDKSVCVDIFKRV